jgi:hypothetical protein
MNRHYDTATWRVSSYSAQNGNCVEIATIANTVAVRDTKNRAGGHLSLSAEGWAALTTSVAPGH